MKKALLLNWAASISVLVGIFGGLLLNPKLFWLVPLGIITSMVGAAIASYKLAALADDEIKRLKK